jgi:hypothetical protein
MRRALIGAIVALALVLIVMACFGFATDAVFMEDHGRNRGSVSSRLDGAALGGVFGELVFGLPAGVVGCVVGGGIGYVTRKK